MLRRFRYEAFGGIVHLTRPRALVFIDRDRARRLGYGGSARWQTAEPSSWNRAPLSAPLEAHLQLTNRCESGCRGCYTGATPSGAADEWDLARWKRAVDALAGRGLFHLALGGGESALLPWLGELASYARERGLVPNLTTSGLYDAATLERLCGWAPRFGQINVSLDGVGEDYARVRGFDGFARADRAIVALRRAHRHVGINCVVTRESFDGLPRLFAHAKRRRLGEIELLRFKPSGRGVKGYAALRCSDTQHQALLPTLLGLARRHRLRVRLDCSFTPMIACHGTDPTLMRWLSIYGCGGGDLLVAAKADGALAPCSFAAPVAARVDGAEAWDATLFPEFRDWEAAAEPCRSCDYLPLCRGGCRVVSAHVAGSLAAPDPECPRVIAWRGQRGRVHLPLV